MEKYIVWEYISRTIFLLGWNRWEKASWTWQTKQIIFRLAIRSKSRQIINIGGPLISDTTLDHGHVHCTVLRMILSTVLYHNYKLFSDSCAVPYIVRKSWRTNKRYLTLPYRSIFLCLKNWMRPASDGSEPCAKSCSMSSTSSSPGTRPGEVRTRMLLTLKG